MTGNIVLDNNDIARLVENICIEIDNGDFLPDVIVGIGRGGAVPAVMISHYFDIPYVNIPWSKQDPTSNETNCWLPEDAYNGKKILIVDDICRTGSTFEDICEDWDSSIRGLKDYDTWYDNVKFASLHSVEGVEFFVDFIGEEIPISDDVIYPWENWWA